MPQGLQGSGIGAGARGRARAPARPRPRPRAPARAPRAPSPRTPRPTRPSRAPNPARQAEAFSCGATANAFFDTPGSGAPGANVTAVGAAPGDYDTELLQPMPFHPRPAAEQQPGRR
jgi:hypothetical protein